METHKQRIASEMVSGSIVCAFTYATCYGNACYRISLLRHRTFQVGYVRKFKGKKLTEKDTQGTQDVIDVTDNLQKDVYVHNQPTSEAEDEENDNSANQQNVTL